LKLLGPKTEADKNPPKEVISKDKKVIFIIFILSISNLKIEFIINFRKMKQPNLKKLKKVNF
jgi:hypothetical protein